MTRLFEILLLRGRSDTFEAAPVQTQGPRRSQDQRGPIPPDRKVGQSCGVPYRPFPASCAPNRQGKGFPLPCQHPDNSPHPIPQATPTVLRPAPSKAANVLALRSPSNPSAFPHPPILPFELRLISVLIRVLICALGCTMPLPTLHNFPNLVQRAVISPQHSVHISQASKFGDGSSHTVPSRSKVPLCHCRSFSPTRLGSNCRVVSGRRGPRDRGECVRSASFHQRSSFGPPWDTGDLPPWSGLTESTPSVTQKPSVTISCPSPDTAPTSCSSRTTLPRTPVEPPVPFSPKSSREGSSNGPPFRRT